jgi:hypothetical protein
MNRRSIFALLSVGCLVLVVLAGMAVAGFFFAFSRETMVRQSDFVTSEPVRVQESSSDDVEAQRAIPTFTPAPAEGARGASDELVPGVPAMSWCSGCQR